jgi:hypothetical protein
MDECVREAAHVVRPCSVEQWPRTPTPRWPVCERRARPRVAGPRVADGDRPGATWPRSACPRWVGSERLDAGKEIGEPTSIAIPHRGSALARKNDYPQSTPG